MKYSDFICKQLKKMGYTHCFTLTGGNIMHLIESASNYFEIIPVVNEVAAGIGAEYFNESSNKKNGKAFALVTAGPGLTNIITAITGAFLESRELLVIGGQVKISDLSNGQLRQKGIQEIDGVNLTKSVANFSVLLTETISSHELSSHINKGNIGRKGPVFLEIPLDLQARNIEESEFDNGIEKSVKTLFVRDDIFSNVVSKVSSSMRPVILVGGGVDRDSLSLHYNKISQLGIPIMTTWNGADRIGCDHELYFGRPNIWGQRYANVILQQTDLLIAIGTRLGLQQTGFNWQEFVTKGEIIHVDYDLSELDKEYSNADIKIQADANEFLIRLFNSDLGAKDYREWTEFCNIVKESLPVNEAQANKTGSEYISPYAFCSKLSGVCSNTDIVIPCSSGGAYTSMMQAFDQKKGQIIISNKALASMGYGLSGAIGASISYPDRKVILTEGDGGFSQNLQELATVNYHKLNLKIFLFDNSGYASIRMTQKNYFNGKYVGCDNKTGLGFPNWEMLFSSYSIESYTIDSDNFLKDQKFLELFNSNKPVAFVVKIDPEQTYFPKISSRVKEDGSMVSNPLHIMSPELDVNIQKKLFKYI